MTGLPPTLSIGFGIRCVWGRSRVPLPARGMMTFMASASWRARPLATVLVPEPHDVVEVRRRGLEHVAIGDRHHLVDGAGRDAERLAGPELHVLQLPRSLDPALQLHAVAQLTAQQVH